MGLTGGDGFSSYPLRKLPKGACGAIRHDSGLALPAESLTKAILRAGRVNGGAEGCQ